MEMYEEEIDEEEIDEEEMYVMYNDMYNGLRNTGYLRRILYDTCARECVPHYRQWCDFAVQKDNVDFIRYPFKLVQIANKQAESIKRIDELYTQMHIKCQKECPCVQDQIQKVQKVQVQKVQKVQDHVYQIHCIAEKIMPGTPSNHHGVGVLKCIYCGICEPTTCGQQGQRQLSVDDVYNLYIVPYVESKK